MASYVLKYYKDIPQTDGSVIRLEILKKQETNDVPSIPIDGDIVVNPDLAYNVEIGGVVKSLHLQIQGEQGDVDAPIVKTSLSMTFVDAPDIIDGRKNGNWDEFYTADATGWKVILKEKTLTSTEFKAIWGGYITPDSYSEDLVYHGSVTIVARDNIGHLQDFPFDAGDADGMVNLYTIVASALAKIESPMDYDFFGDGGNSANDVTHWLKCKDKPLYDARMNVSFFEGMNYYEALEKALYALGCVMRYVGRNKFYICPLMDMPKHGYYSYSYFATKEPIFVTGATRELVPAVKIIEEEDIYDIVEAEQPLVKEEDFTGYTYRVEWYSIQTAPVQSISNANANGWRNTTPSKARYFNPKLYEVHPPAWYPSQEIDKEEIYNAMWLFTGGGQDIKAEYKRSSVAPADLNVKMEFGRAIELIENSSLPSLPSTFIQVSEFNNFSVGHIWFAIKAYSNGETQYLNSEGKWQSAYVVLDKVVENNVFDHTIPLSLLSSQVDFVIEFVGFESSSLARLYVSVKSLKFTTSPKRTYCEKKTIKTIYNESNNVILKRDPELAPAQDIVADPGIIKNGIFVDYVLTKYPAREWTTAEGYTAELPVHIHKQLLSYHAKPNNLISGTIVNSGTMGLSCNWLWRGKEHILTSGSLNLITGHMEGAVLREFTRYDDMWNEAGDEIVPEGGGNITPENPSIPIG